MTTDDHGPQWPQTEPPDRPTDATWAPIPGPAPRQPYGDPGYGQLQPYGPPPGYPAMPAPGLPMPTAKPSALPDGPREYQQMLRGPRHRWWRPLLSLLLFAVIAFLLIQLVFPVVLLIGVALGEPHPLRWALDTLAVQKNMSATGFLATNLSLIVLIPAAMLAIWIAHRIRPRFLSSVAGGLRWRWLLRCVLITVPVWLVYMTISLLVEPQSGARPAHWVLLLVMVVLMTPLQAAGEEYAFRGFVLQSIGSWFRHPIVALVVPMVLSVGAFAAAHGSPNFWVLADLGLFAVVAAIATWRTGGLEAGIAIHAVNNMSVFFTVILFGGWEDAFVGENTTSTPLALGISALVNGVALALILWQAKRAGIQRLYQPTVTSPPTGEARALATARLDS
ncbi:CPBP family intramembrane metalloprotease [Microlunatus panaciterrae]|uniref:Membrane protease YdiL (CAAX protease family) n=1 Tax=Microlunatus panaciterrae TaxID=400768 RepID=A0ABS2RJQ2_9ACTN|nr:type II CAAX endopeptidase family protein [Microlunatus panaciterrae]MBM7799235.1 membrane protease YdiL (CAAX protease family) [Microlunatus panaciterrae]